MPEQRSYPIWVEYWPEDWPHGHMLLIADGSVPAAEAWARIREDMEGYADELAGVVLQCSRDRHDGHGREHTQEDARKAFLAAMDQLLTRDYAKEWAEQAFREAMFKKWGGHMPAAVLMFHPDDPTQETLMVPNARGDPMLYLLPRRRKVLREFMDRPRDGKNAVKHPTGLGWLFKPPEK